MLEVGRVLESRDSPVQLLDPAVDVGVVMADAVEGKSESALPFTQGAGTFGRTSQGWS